MKNGNGVGLAYTLRAHRDPAAPRVALVHSLGLGRMVWEGVAERLAADASVLTYDARGHAASAKPPGPYEVARFADDLAALLDAVGWDAAHVGGCSMGGMVALAFAAAYPQRTRTLALVDTTAFYGDDAVQAWDQRAQAARDKGLASMIDFQETRWFGDAFRAERPDVVARARALFLANDVDAYAATCAMLGHADLRERLRDIRVPAAILVGEEDYATPPAMSQALHAGIAGSTLEVLSGARHLTPLQEPDVVADRLRALIARAAA